MILTNTKFNKKPSNTKINTSHYKRRDQTHVGSDYQKKQNLKRYKHIAHSNLLIIFIKHRLTALYNNVKTRFNLSRTALWGCQ